MFMKDFLQDILYYLLYIATVFLCRYGALRTMILHQLEGISDSV